MTYDSYQFPEQNYADINDSKQKLSDFFDNFQAKVDEFEGLFDGLTQSLYVGNVETLQKILGNLNNSIKTESTKLNTHLEDVKSFMGNVTDYMDKDKAAQEAAYKEYGVVMADSAAKDRNTIKTYDADGNLTSSVYDRQKHMGEAHDKADKVWIANRCALWR